MRVSRVRVLQLTIRSVNPLTKSNYVVSHIIEGGGFQLIVITLGASPS